MSFNSGYTMHMYVTPHPYCTVIMMYTLLEKWNTSIKCHIHLKYNVKKKHIIKWSKTSVESYGVHHIFYILKYGFSLYPFIIIFSIH